MSTPYRQASDTSPDLIEFNVGELVRVVGQPLHYPQMTVIDQVFGVGEYVECGWFDKDHRFRAQAFRKDVLVRC